MTKIWKWLVDHKGWLKYWYIPFLILGAVFVYKDCSNNDDEVIEALKNGIKHRDVILDGYKNTIYTQQIDIGELTKRSKKSERSFKKLKGEFEDYKNIKPPVIIKTLTRVQIIKEYERVYNFAKRTIESFSVSIQNGIDIEKELNKLFPVINDYIVTSEENTMDREKIIKLKSKQKRWGLYFGFGITQNKNFAINLSIGYRIF